ncbi:MAG: VacJ family lipoprotein [Magnetococcales bacterium]|nr:VacJ family lipoprotein [Magnetococcales bacterium]MBF0151172.1 VacJ family lipoprotein [Magnetococcales bacterium]MBF0174628.1 VacJ family lipoprotein [Magnetococcales bacterium]MBF0348678.1 VacJ family lipoprotein [Magnetococcales bacterium]MBF0632654.1 VacJ family lipoprotein [Magnetococcales bacterium]
MLLRLMLLLFLVSVPVRGAMAGEPMVERSGTSGYVEDSGGVVNSAASSGASKDVMDGTADADVQDEVSDPLEPFNRAMFVVNDMIYSVIIKPLAHIYAAVTPEVFRIAVQNFFHNLGMPTHFLNALLQQKPDVAGRELFRFVINTTVGVLGFYDAADRVFNLKTGDEDTGQTLGTYGIGDAVYINWPVLGPSNLRDSVGLVGDAFLNPLSYVPNDVWARAGIQGYRRVNDTSLRLGEYEDLKKAALDPYTAVRDAYLQTRRRQISQ